MKFPNDHFGELEICDDRLITFAGGLSEQYPAERWALVAHTEGDAFAFLVSPDDPKAWLMVAEPEAFVKDYRPKLAQELVGCLGPAASVGGRGRADVLFLAVVTSDGKQLRMDLAQPIAISVRTWRGCFMDTDPDERHNPKAAIDLTQLRKRESAAA